MNNDRQELDSARTGAWHLNNGVQRVVTDRLELHP
jgi:hypothetical protein